MADWEEWEREMYDLVTNQSAKIRLSASDAARQLGDCTSDNADLPMMKLSILLLDGEPLVREAAGRALCKLAHKEFGDTSLIPRLVKVLHDTTQDKPVLIVVATVLLTLQTKAQERRDDRSKALANEVVIADAQNILISLLEEVRVRELTDKCALPVQEEISNVIWQDPRFKG